MPEKIQVVTRPREEVEALAQHLQLDIEDGVLDMGEVKLVLNGKRDAYYTVKREACSCPDYLYRQSANGGRCKHILKLFPEQPKPSEEVPRTMSLRENIWASQENDVFSQPIARPKARGAA